MECKIITPAPWLQPQFSVCIRNLIAVIKDEPRASNKCIPPELGTDLIWNYDGVLSSINDCLLLVRTINYTYPEYAKLGEDYDLIKKMWNEFETQNYDCIDIFFKIVNCYYEAINYTAYHKKDIITESKKTEMETKLKTLYDAFQYFKEAEDIILLAPTHHGPCGIPEDDPEYKKIFNENGNFIHKAQDIYYDRNDYQKFLQQMHTICVKMQNNIRYKCSDLYALRTNAYYTGTRLKRDFEDKSIVMIKKLYLLFNNEFGKSYTQYIKAITNILFPAKKRKKAQVNEILRIQSSSKKKLKNFKKI